MKLRNFRWSDSVQEKLDWLVENSIFPEAKNRTSLLVHLIQTEYSVRSRDALQKEGNALHNEKTMEAEK